MEVAVKFSFKLCSFTDPAAVNLAVHTTLCFSSIKMCLFWRNTERPFHKRRLLLRTDIKHSRDKAISVIYRCRVLEILIVHVLFVSGEMMTCSCQPSDLCSGDPSFLIRPVLLLLGVFRDSFSLEYQYRLFKQATASYKILHFHHS